MKGKLFLVPTPLDFGCSIQDSLDHVLPAHTIRIAARLSCWLCEDARTTRGFLKRVQLFQPLTTPLQSQDIRPLPRAVSKGQASMGETQLASMLQPALQGIDIGLISEAGMPAIADPGQAIVRTAHELGIQVIPLVGPVSMLLALAASGLNGQNFAFVGYLPVEAGARESRIRELESWSLKSGQSQQFIEVPYRNGAMLASLLKVLQPGTHLSVACGLTQQAQHIRSGSVANWRKREDELPLQLPAIFSLGP